jgi:hypothetical protein
MRSHLIEVYSQERSAKAECSIVVPVYNGARFLSDSIPSVLGQSDIVCDILISDDCSDDGSLEAVVARANMPLLVAASRCDRIVQAHQDDVSDPRRASVLTSALTGKAKLVTSVARVRTATDLKEPTKKAVAALKKNADFRALLVDGRGVIRGACYGMHRDLFRCFPPLSWDYLSHGHDVLLYIRARIIGRCGIIYSPLLTVGEHSERGFYQLIDRQDSATSQFDFALRRLAILKAAQADLTFAEAAGLVDATRRQKVGDLLDEVRHHFLDVLVTNRELAIQRGFRLSWTKRVGRLG